MFICFREVVAEYAYTYFIVVIKSGFISCSNRLGWRIFEPVIVFFFFNLMVNKIFLFFASQYGPVYK